MPHYRNAILYGWLTSMAYLCPMKKVLLLLYLFTAVQILQAQLRQDVNTLDAGHITIPDSVCITTTSMARYVNARCKTPYEKLSTFYKWVTRNIKYDADSVYYFNWSKPAAIIAATTIQRRKGVCENFAALFTELLVQTGIPTWLVTGYTMAAGTVAYTGHSWCAVQLDSTWWLCDPTWDAADNNTKWLMVAPDDFLATHMPFDPMWQLRSYPITHNAFKKGKWKAADNAPYFNYPDSLKLFFQLDSLQQLEAFTRRMYASGLENNRLKLWHSYNEMKIAIIYGDKDMELYNTAVALFNKATGIYNGFVQYRNSQFVPIRADKEIAGLLVPIAALITEAEQHLNLMGLVVENFQYDTGEIRERLKALMARTQTQQAFVRSYLAAAPEQRKKMF
jgi:Transglutaminase-like superfamily